MALKKNFFDKVKNQKFTKWEAVSSITRRPHRLTAFEISFNGKNLYLGKFLGG
jgi:hypothetical protein